ncbi:hypothetical protein [Nannocystis pusilla]|uniref:hypothetical protein n=1 Tax=Nannocystis pusilla TaxID=889268 RepID=UPI003DA6ABAD
MALASAATVAACGEAQGPCGPLARLCADEGRWQAIAPRVDAAVAVDLDADGEAEYVVIDRQGEQLAVAYPDGARSAVVLTAQGPTAIAALSGEVVVALSLSAGARRLRARRVGTADETA